MAAIERPRGNDAFDPFLPTADLSVFWEPSVDALELSTEEDLVHSIVRFASMRKLRRSRAQRGKVA